jgi:hypothetical protein
MARSSFSGAMLGRPSLDVGRVHAREEKLNFLQSLVDQLANSPQGMVLGHKVVDASNAEQALGKAIGSAHGEVFGGWRDGY